MRKVRTARVLKSFGQWVVTTYGVECTEYPYPIEVRRLWEQNGEYTWEMHVSKKTWVHADSFCRAMEWARNHFAKRQAAG